jgi:hypothetical protein
MRRLVVHTDDAADLLSETCIRFSDTSYLSCPKFAYIFRTQMPTKAINLKDQISRRIALKAAGVWTPTDFIDLGNRDAVDKVLQRLARAGEIRRINRGLYDRPAVNSLTKKPTTPDYREVIRGILRRDQSRILVDGITAANDLGLTDAVPARVVVHTDGRIRPVRLDNLTIDFKQTAPSKLYWAGRPAMRVVQALHWLRDMLPGDNGRIMKRLRAILNDPAQGKAIRDDLRSGLATLPIWMQAVVRDLLESPEELNRQ